MLDVERFNFGLSLLQRLCIVFGDFTTPSVVCVCGGGGGECCKKYLKYKMQIFVVKVLNFFNISYF